MNRIETNRIEQNRMDQNGITMETIQTVKRLLKWVDMTDYDDDVAYGASSKCIVLLKK